MANKVTQAKLAQLIPDDLNANKHSEYGMALLEKSISQNGLGRSILIDKNNKIIGGNGVTETASNLDLTDVIIVETDGTKLVAVKRTDVDINSKVGRELALSDNSVARVNLQWDEENIKKIQEEWDVIPEEWGIREFEHADDKPDDKDLSGSIKSGYKIEIDCVSEAQQELLYNELIERGITCRILTL